MANAQLVLDVVQEGRRAGRQLEQVVQLLGAVAHAERVAELAESPAGEAVARGQPHVLGASRLEQRAHPLAVARVALVVAAVALEHPA